MQKIARAAHVREEIDPAPGLDVPGEVQCLQPVDGSEPDVDAINACGLGLRERFGFPDPRCPEASPMAELDGAVLEIPDLAVEPADAAPVEAADPEPAVDASQAPR